MKIEPWYLVIDTEGFPVSYKCGGLYRAAFFDTETKAREFITYMKNMTGLRIRRVWFGDFVE